MLAKVLLTDDDAPFISVLGPELKEAGYSVEIAHDGLQALRRLYEWRPDLVILDVMMPGMDGWEACHWMRNVSDVPILMLTARGGESNELKSLESGADDFMTKPFSVSVLIARMQALLRRGSPDGKSSRHRVERIGDLEIDLARREAAIGGRGLSLSPKEFNLLAALASRPGEVITREELLTRVWGAEYVGEDLYLKQYISYLRQKIERDPGSPRYILTKRGVGYYLNDYPAKESTA